MNHLKILVIVLLSSVTIGNALAQNEDLMSGEGYIPLYESDLYLSAAGESDDEDFLEDATMVQTGPENILLMIVALLLAILLYKKYSPFTEK